MNILYSTYITALCDDQALKELRVFDDIRDYINYMILLSTTLTRRLFSITKYVCVCSVLFLIRWDTSVTWKPLYFDDERCVYRITRAMCTTIVASGFVYIQLCFPSGTEIITKITREFRERGDVPRDKVIRYLAYAVTLYASY